jgi:hypothetical protein
MKRFVCFFLAIVMLLAMTACGKDEPEVKEYDGAALMQALLALPANPLGLHAFVADFDSKVKNLTSALADGRLRAIQGVARAK